MKKTNKELEQKIKGLEVALKNQVERVTFLDDVVKKQRLNIENLKEQLRGADQLSIQMIKAKIDLSNPNEAANKIIESLFKLPLSVGTEFVTQLHANYSEYLRLTEEKRRNSHGFSKKMLHKLLSMSGDVYDGNISFER